MICRLIEAVNFETDEALLTGESLPVQKNSKLTFDANTGPGDRLNIAHSSSIVTKGRATGVVFATVSLFGLTFMIQCQHTYCKQGMNTEIGSIALALRDKKSWMRPARHHPHGLLSPYSHVEAWMLTFTDAVGHFLGVNFGTPLQRKLSRLAVLLFGVTLLCAIIVEASNGFSGSKEVIIYAVATGLSMIPASLSAVLIITMAVGTQRMVQRNVIVRKLDSLEALGAITNICTDKTGTLTQGFS
jgi:Na+-exporting ATPase